MFAVATHTLWYWRKKRINNPNYLLEADPIVYIRRRVHEFDPITQHKERGLVYVRWHMPPVGWIKIHTDGCSKGNPGAAGGGST